MTEQQAKEILHRYRSGLCTPAEEAAISQWIDNLGERANIQLTEEEQAAYMALLDAKVQKHTGIDISTEAGRSFRPVPAIRRRRIIWAAAAILLLALGSGAYFLSTRFSGSWPATGGHKQIAHNDVAPGSNRATLTLSDGQTVVLDSTVASLQDGHKILKLQDGLLAYNTAAGSGSASTTTLYNTLTTSRAEQYGLVLADGTKVRLNAASSIRYPLSFTGHERMVEITGEAYFEVAHNAAQPFRVKAGGRLIEDIGTTFNVNAYTDEPEIKTTLIEGLVKVSGILLQPGQQAAVSRQTGAVSVHRVQTDDAIAWVNGQLSMEDIGVAELMKQLSRWYAVDIRYEGGVPAGKFGGLIDRNVNLSNVIDVLKANGIHAQLKDKTIIITNR